MIHKNSWLLTLMVIKFLISWKKSIFLWEIANEIQYVNDFCFLILLIWNFSIEDYDSMRVSLINVNIFVINKIPYGRVYITITDAYSFGLIVSLNLTLNNTEISESFQEQMLENNNATLPHSLGRFFWNGQRSQN